MDQRIHEWFTVKQVSDNIMAISEHKHWENTNCFLIMGKEKCALIDTGTGLFGIDAIVREITDKDILIITTHFHWDHIGNHHQFKNIFVHKNEIQWCKNEFPISENIVKELIIKDVDEKYLENNDQLKRYRLFHSDDVKVLFGNDQFDLGGKSLKIVNAPGHSPGHICIIDDQEKYVFTGDLLYKGNLYVNYESTDPLKYYTSIKIIQKNYSEYQFLPAHNEYPLEFNFLNSVVEAFEDIRKKRGLKHGGGNYEYKDFSIRL